MKFSKKILLENSYVISINNFKLKLFYERMKLIDFNNIKHHIGRLDSKDGCKNCNNSHLDIILYSKKNNFDYVTIFEDDAYPINNFNKELSFFLNNIPEDASLISIGYTHGNSIKNTLNISKCDNFIDYQSFFIKQKDIQRCFGSHAYIIFKKDYDRFIYFLSKYDKKNKKYDADCCMYLDNKNFYLKRIPLFVQNNVVKNECLHKSESNECSNELKKLYNI